MLIWGASNRQFAQFFRVQTITITDYDTDTSQQELQQITIGQRSAKENLPGTLIRNVVESMTRRIQQCIRKRGGYTRY